MSASDPVSAICEAGAYGQTAAIFADIRETLGVEVVNLIWRHLATIPGALQWVWSTLKPLYQGPAIGHAFEVRRSLRLPEVPALSADALAAAGLDLTARAGIHSVLDSYHHTNALALVVFSALLARFDDAGSAYPSGLSASTPDPARAPPRSALPRLTPIAELEPPIARLVAELNGFGEDEDFALVASMYRHLSHWPTYLALVRTLLAPLQASGALQVLVAAARATGAAHGKTLAPLLSSSEPPDSGRLALVAVRRFVRHPIARMTGICALIRDATPAA